MAKRKQDLHLDNIEKGLSTLKGIGEAMGETLKTQDVLIDTIDTKVAASYQLSSNSCTDALVQNAVCMHGAVASMPSILILAASCGCHTGHASHILSHTGTPMATHLVNSHVALDTAAWVQMDNVTKELKTNNMKLKGLVESVSSLTCKPVVPVCPCQICDRQAFCAPADALKAEFLHRYHFDLYPAGPRPVSIHDVQEQVSQRGLDAHSLECSLTNKGRLYSCIHGQCVSCSQQQSVSEGMFRFSATVIITCSTQFDECDPHIDGTL